MLREPVTTVPERERLTESDVSLVMESSHSVKPRHIYLYGVQYTVIQRKNRTSIIKLYVCAGKKEGWR